MTIGQRAVGESVTFVVLTRVGTPANHLAIERWTSAMPMLNRSNREPRIAAQVLGAVGASHHPETELSVVEVDLGAAYPR